MVKYGIIGYPLWHSKSPAAFTAAYGGKWAFDRVENPDFDVCWKRFLDEYAGLTVTNPFKELAFRHSDVITPEVERIRATNLVVKTPEGIKAYNSDYRGLVQCIGKAGFRKGDTALIVGCGGAGKAAAAAASELGLNTLITNRTIAKAEAMHEHMGLEIHPFFDPIDCDLVIYTIPGKIDNLERFHARTVLEANYANPSYDEALLKKIGASYINGKVWHYEQAVAGYELMTGVAPDRDSVFKVYELTGWSK
ncbi:MAG: hypothetical protein J5764_02375 [Bacteroidales bacterium]|nr:hypothetical protein [Bacteroidales bacterium]